MFQLGFKDKAGAAMAGFIALVLQAYVVWETSETSTIRHKAPYAKHPLSKAEISDTCLKKT